MYHNRKVPLHLPFKSNIKSILHTIYNYNDLSKVEYGEIALIYRHITVANDRTITIIHDDSVIYWEWIDGIYTTVKIKKYNFVNIRFACSSLYRTYLVYHNKDKILFRIIKKAVRIIQRFLKRCSTLETEYIKVLNLIATTYQRNKFSRITLANLLPVIEFLI